MPIKERMMATTNSGTIIELKCDQNGLLVNEPHQVYRNHLGEVFAVTTTIEDLDAAHIYDIILGTDAACEIHLLGMEIYTSGKAHAYLFEDTVYTIIGIPKTPVCLNRTAVTSSSVAVLTGSTETSSISITSTGDLLLESHYPADSKKNVAALNDFGVELILKDHTNYLLRVDNEDSTDIALSILLLFVKHC